VLIAVFASLAAVAVVGWGEPMLALRTE